MKDLITYLRRSVDELVMKFDFFDRGSLLIENELINISLVNSLNDLIYAELSFGVNPNPYLDWIGVSKPIRNRGVGSALLSVVIDSLRNAGFNKLNVIKPFKEAIPFYKKFNLIKCNNHCYIPLNNDCFY